ncbi:nitrogen fixation protein NifU [Geoalkalibacter ferrihydriticus]|uniref:Nitrogen fixation protein NifU n=2 Tax=Geoalkalibacter ferrihydriticus TaxID=392333 RepID=A0A0C2HLN3_9BACT|nr:iron-sulfur cluster assembly scaffold protein NifU [Geoalkalibacter ferrihydriticus]KIH75905.1 nitrogen fixation protein NifU [Geoalkalibacter ferrihydriticus DSM 17813]SDM54353.1 nitrogen fixation protein NifU [Geoalkalibacter ferrihydriticus]
MYSPKVMDHFANPRNVGVIDDANVVVQAGDPGCGDGLLIFLKIEEDRIRDIKYKIYGCGAAIATSSVASEMAMGKTLDEVLMLITEKSIAAALDGLPPEKMHCSNLAAGALRAAVKQYRKMGAEAKSAES